jgi:hypothetical protein
MLPVTMFCRQIIIIMGQDILLICNNLEALEILRKTYEETLIKSSCKEKDLSEMLDLQSCIWQIEDTIETLQKERNDILMREYYKIEKG